MNWFKENKFVGGLLVVTVLGAGSLGYLLFGAKSKYAESVAAFDTQSKELSRLESLPAYPYMENLEVLQAQRVEHQALIADLHKSLAATVLPVEPMTPNSFQDQLRAAVTQFNGKVGAISLPKGFYYGFEPYQTTPPNEVAAPLLGRELKAIQLLFQILLDKGQVQSIATFNRDVLPEESNKKPEPPKTPVKKPGDKTAAAAAPAEPLVKPHAVDLVFTADQRGLADFLSALASNEKQYFITRYIALHNTNEKPPLRENLAVEVPGAADPNTPAVPGTVVAGNPTATDIIKDPTVVGHEKVEVTLRLEIVEFAAALAPAMPAPKPASGAGK